MLDPKFIRENSKLIKKDTKNKNRDEKLVDEWLLIDKKRSQLMLEVELLRKERNELSGSNKKPSEDIIKKVKGLKEKLVSVENSLSAVEDTWKTLLEKIPNVISSEVKVGVDESFNEVIKTVGKISAFNFKPLDHMELGTSNYLIDTEISSKVSGSRFNYLFNEAVFLQFAIIQYVLETLTNEEIIKKIAKSVGNPFNTVFTPVIPPVIAKAEVMKKMDRYDPIDDRYYFKEDDSLFIGSAEHTLGPIHMNETILEEKLPIRYIGYSTAFRREAGSYGKDTSGILRRHQFDKLEMETFTLPEYGPVEQDFIVAIQEYLVQGLKIPYQIVRVCTGDMGKPDFRQLDIECFMPSQNKYRETHTSDYMTDYQARRLEIRYKTKKGDKGFVHMNDATAFAIGRTLIAILENYQQKDGSVVIPEVLRKYMGGRELIKK